MGGGGLGNEIDVGDVSGEGGKILLDRLIIANVGEDGAVIAGRVLENESYNFGFDAQNGVYGDMVAAGIIDPAKVVRVALQNAASVAGLLITTEAMVSNRPEKAAGAGMGGHGGGGMGGMGGMGDMDY